jgi:hypothetical protein
MPHPTKWRRTDEAASNKPREFGNWTFLESGLQRAAGKASDPFLPGKDKAGTVKSTAAKIGVEPTR